jgi:hypothetical protein
MVFGQPVVGTIVSAAELAFEGQVNVCPAILAFQDLSNFQVYLNIKEELLRVT